MNRSPLAKQEISSQFSGCFEGIGRFPGDPCKFHPQPDHQMGRHVHTTPHSTGETTTEFPGRVEHARHFPTHMEMCMNDHFTQTTEGTQQQYLQDISHAEFPSGMENTPSFPGKQFLQGKEENMDTGTFTIENIILNRHPTLSTLTHPGRVQQNLQRLKMESSNMVALPCFNFNAEATTQMETSKKGADGRDTTVTSSLATPMDHPMDNIQPPTRKCISTMNVHSQDSHSNKSDQLKKSKVQGNRLTGLSHQFNTDFTCDQKSLSRDLHNYWNHRETLSTNLKIDTNMDTNHMTTIPTTHKEVYLLPGPLKAMAHRYRHTEKEAHLLSGPSEL